MRILKWLMASVVPMTLGACGGGDSGTSTFGATTWHSFDSDSAGTLTLKFTSPVGLTPAVP
jgi:hypothetical protein